MDSLSSLNIFVHAAKSLNFTEAGRQLGLSSSAIGKAVARLEDSFGVRLFHRSTRRIILTREGEAFLDRCERIFAEVKAVEHEFAQSRRDPVGKLRIGLPPMGSLMLPALSRFMRKYPAIEFDIDVADHPIDVIGGGYDLAVRMGELHDSRLMCRRLGGYRLRIVASPGYLARFGEPRTPEDLRSHACLHRRCPATGKAMPWPFNPSDAANPLLLPSAAVTNAVEPLISMLEYGSGIGCVPDFLVRERIEAGTLVSVLEDSVDHQEVVTAVWPSSRHLAPKVRALVDFLADTALADHPRQEERADILQLLPRGGRFEPPRERAGLRGGLGR